MLKTLQCISGLPRIKSKPLIMANKAPYPHLLHSLTCLLIASHLASSLALKEAYFPALELCTAVPSAQDTPPSPRSAHDPLLSLRLSSSIIPSRRPSLAFQTKSAPLPSVLYHSLCFILFTVLITIWNYFVYLFIDCLTSLSIPEKQGPFLSCSPLWLQRLTQCRHLINICYMNEWFLNWFHCHLPMPGQIFNSAS